MHDAGWRLFRVRPENHPAQRLAGAARLVAQFAGTGLVEGVLRDVARALPGSTALEGQFMVPATGAEEGGPRLIGQGRAREIVINTALPFAHAWAEVNSQPDLTRHALDLYRACPSSGGYGATRDLAQRLLGNEGSRAVNTARRQQGLVHIDGTYCRPRECAPCPFGQ
jgi:hypothetical protein